MADVTIFSPGSLFSTLAARGGGEAAPLSRALRSALVDPQGFAGVGGAAPQIRVGLSTDLPALVARPLELAAENVLLLAAETVGRRLEGLREETDALRREIEDALIDSAPGARNDAGAFLSSLDFAALVEAAQQTLAPDAGPAAQPAQEIAAGAARNPDARLGDFTQRPGEQPVFGAAFTALARDDSLRTQFQGRAALTEGAQVSLADLILAGAETAPGGEARRFAVSLNGGLQEDGTLVGAAGSLVDDLGQPIANGTEIAAADLATTFFRAGTNVRALDYLSVVELRAGAGADPDRRGAYQTAALSTSLAPQDRIEIEEERIRDFTFFTESGGALTSIKLDFSGVDDEGFTDALAALEAGEIRVKAREIFADGTVNEAVIDRRESSGDRLQADFARGAAQAGVESLGLQVELRALNPDFDISGVALRVAFG